MVASTHGEVKIHNTILHSGTGVSRGISSTNNELLALDMNSQNDGIYEIIQNGLVNVWVLDMYIYLSLIHCI